MNPPLSVVIASHSDRDLPNTLASIRATAGDAPEVIVVDDAGGNPVTPSHGATVIRNTYRCGVGPSRHIGVLAARGEVVLIVDAHMRFLPGWYDALLNRIALHPDWLICGVCLGLDAQHLDPNRPVGLYHGGTINVMGPDANSKFAKTQVFEATWNKTAPEDNAEICAVMGASYAMHRSWFLKIDALRHLRSWGEDELMLSVKTWLAGGSVRLHHGLRVGHRFRMERERVPFPIPREDTIHNKLFAIQTLLPAPLAKRLTSALRVNPRYGSYRAGADAGWAEVACEQALNRSLFTRDFYWLAGKFGLHLPDA